MRDKTFHENFYTSIMGFQRYKITFDRIEVNNDVSKLDIVRSLNLNVNTLHESAEILISNIGIAIFDDISSYLTFPRLSECNNLLIFKGLGDQPMSYINGTTYLNFVQNESSFLFKNSISYARFLDKLKNLESEIDGTFHFVDSYNRDARKITLISLAEKGRLVMSYKSGVPELDVRKNYTIGFDNFISCFSEENKNLPRFLKNSVINIVSGFDESNRVQSFFESLVQIVNKARINYEVFLNELSIDKVKKEYDDLKIKYFEGLSGILSKLTNNILALPIAVAALLFSIEKIKDMQVYLSILGIVILFTSIYLSLILKVNFKDVTFIDNVSSKDLNAIKENNFFLKYPEELIDFKTVKKRIEDRVRFLKLIIRTYFWVLNISNIVVLALVQNHLGLSWEHCFIVSLILLLAITLLEKYVLDEDTKDDTPILV